MGEVEMVAKILPEMRIRPASRQLEIGRTDKADETEASGEQGEAGSLLPTSPRKLEVDAIEALRSGQDRGEAADTGEIVPRPGAVTPQEQSKN